MLPEVAYVKLSWLFGCGYPPEKVRELVQKNVAGEINEKLSADDFLF
jgi:glutamyl-tRNA(Gln) amidotransferase subunit D